MQDLGALDTPDERFRVGSFALLIVRIGQAGTTVMSRQPSARPDRRDLDSGPGLPNGYLSWRAKETFESAPRRRHPKQKGTIVGIAITLIAGHHPAGSCPAHPDGCSLPYNSGCTRAFQSSRRQGRIADLGGLD